MLSQLISWLKHIALSGPLEVFVFIGSILEEVVPPIPTPLIMSLAGYIAHQRDSHILYFIFLALIGALGKTLASVMFYYVGDRAEDVVVSRWGKLLGLEREKLDKLSALLNKGWWDEILLVVLRILPLIPTFIVSLACGVLHTPLRTFVWTTFIGSFIRNLLLVWLGVAGTAYVQKFWDEGGAEMAQQPMIIGSGIIGLLIGCCIGLAIKRHWSKVSK
jgi:membrane protein DedA with SNARE-associated domain